MRLLHTERLEFQEFFDSQTPKYAILSHRWTSNEVSFRDFNHCKERRRSNFNKIKDFCSLAKKNRYEWGWIDTCCIDKRSSAELTEAINSMYAWYQKAGVCYAYLPDVVLFEGEGGNWEGTRAQFRRSAWFTRGWTLQELLAPPVVIFFDRGWKLVGSKEDNSSKGRSLHSDISGATGIRKHELTNAGVVCVAKKFSWLSGRKTTRVEDMAYCMLGLCGVNMPLLYGEGEKAFFRLQLEIIKNSDDESIFAWFCDNTGRPSSFTSGMIAHSPENFAKSGHIENYSSVMAKRNSPYSMTNKGLAYTIPWPKGWLDKRSTIDDVYLLPLGCQFSGPSYSDPAEDANPYQGPNKHSDVVTICLERKEGGIWQRIHYQDKHICMLPKAWDYMVEEGRSFETIYVQDYGLHCFEDWEKEPSELYEDVLSCGSIRRGDTIICLTHSP